jgi:hypothetical protein
MGQLSERIENTILSDFCQPTSFQLKPLLQFQVENGHARRIDGLRCDEVSATLQYPCLPYVVKASATISCTTPKRTKYGLETFKISQTTTTQQTALNRIRCGSLAMLTDRPLTEKTNGGVEKICVYHIVSKNTV